MEIGTKMRENMSMRECHIGLDVQKICSAKISTFTVLKATELNQRPYIRETMHSALNL